MNAATTTPPMHQFTVQPLDGKPIHIEVPAAWTNPDGTIYPGLIDPSEWAEAARKSGIEHTWQGERDLYGPNNRLVATVTTRTQWEAEQASVDQDDSLGPCGCTDYHMADCPLITG